MYTCFEGWTKTITNPHGHKAIDGTKPAQGVQLETLIHYAAMWISMEIAGLKALPQLITSLLAIDSPVQARYLKGG